MNRPRRPAGSGVSGVTALIPTYDAERKPLLGLCIDSLLHGSHPPDQVLVVVDSARHLAAELADELQDSRVEVVESRGRGASQARNTGLELAVGEIVVCLDDDAYLEGDWYEHLKEAFDDPRTVAVGGHVVPGYEPDAQPLPEELLWVVGSTYRGHRQDAGPISRPIGAFMAFRRDAVIAVGGFCPEFGPRPGRRKSSSNEEIVLAEALRRKFGPDCIVFLPNAHARHFVPAWRTRWPYLVHRSWVEGRSKAGVRHLYGGSVMADDSRYAWGVLLPSVARYALRGNVKAAGQCATAGVVTAAGYTRGLMGPVANRMAGRSATGDQSAACHQSDPLVRSSLLIMASTAAGSLLGFAYWAVAARLFPASSVGLAAGLVSAMTLVSTVATLGLHSGLTQELPRSDDQRWSVLFNGSLAFGGVAGAISSLTWLMFPLLSSSLGSGGGMAFALFALGIVGATVSFLLDYTFVAERAAGHMLARNAVFGVAKVVALAVVYEIAGASALTVFGTWVGVQAAVFAGSLAFSVPRLERDWRLRLKGATVELRRLTRSLAGHHAATLGALLPMYVLPLEVVARVSTRANAWFYVCWMMSALFFMVSPAVSSSLFAEGSHSPDEIRSAAVRSARMVAALIVPAGALFLLVGRPLLGAFGASYASHGYLLLVVLVASAVPDAVTNIAVSVLRVERRLVEAAALNVGMAALTVILAWFLLPDMGIVGAGVAWLAAQGAGAVVVLLAPAVANIGKLGRIDRPTVATTTRSSDR